MRREVEVRASAGTYFTCMVPAGLIAALFIASAGNRGGASLPVALAAATLFLGVLGLLIRFNRIRLVDGCLSFRGMHKACFPVDSIRIVLRYEFVRSVPVPVLLVHSRRQTDAGFRKPTKAFSRGDLRRLILALEEQGVPVAFEGDLDTVVRGSSHR